MLPRCCRESAARGAKTRRVRGLLLALFLALVLAGPATARAPGWDPARTWVFAVGLLEWQDSETFPGFDKKDRRDRQLVELFRKRGVPEGQIVYLEDQAATRARIQEELDGLLARTRPGDLLVLYYAGHGYRNEAGTFYMTPYDTDEDDTAWSFDSVLKALDRSFRGDRVLAAADCCYSGSLRALTARRTGRPGFGTLTSSLSRVESTGNWTFTDALLSGLRGEPAVDADRNGAVTFDEVGRYMKREMAFADDQLGMYGTTPGFSPDTVLAVTDRPLLPREGEHVEVLEAGTWWKARILQARDGRVQVRWLGMDGYEDEWVKADRVRPAGAKPATRYAAGTKVDVEWEGTWWPAVVREVDGDGIHHIHYEGYADSWDEWVSAKRVRPRN